jgi:hypothetical protein
MNELINYLNKTVFEEDTSPSIDVFISVFSFYHSSICWFSCGFTSYILLFFFNGSSSPLGAQTSYSGGGGGGLRAPVTRRAMLAGA